MKKLTKKQRNKAYIEAHESNLVTATCWHFIKYTDNSFEKVKTQFPEFYLFEPLHCENWGTRWFKNENKTGSYLKSNMEHRKIILEFCIEMTK